MPRERALACAVRLLDLGFFRVGGEAYPVASAGERMTARARASLEREVLTLVS
jgi:hypothetical protein